MSDRTTTQATDPEHSGANQEATRTEEALKAALRNEIKFRYLVLAFVVGGVWWWALDPISAFTAWIGLVVLSAVLGPTIGVIATTRWPTTEAVVRESEVLTRRQARERVGQPGALRGGVTGYVPLIRYEYTVDGTTYENARVSPFDASTKRRSRVEQVVDRYPVGKRVPVKYRPGDPSQSYLRSWSRASRLNTFFPIALSVLAFAVVIAVGIRTEADAVVGLVPIIVGAPALLSGLYGTWRAAQTYRWPSTPGVVTGTAVRSTGGSGETGSSGYELLIHYEYDVDGTRYVSKRYSFGGRPAEKTRSAAEERMSEEFPVDSEVTVHYHPDRPDASVLERGGVGSSIALVLIGLAFTAIGVYIYSRPDLAVPQVVEQWIDQAREWIESQR